MASKPKPNPYLAKGGAVTSTPAQRAASSKAMDQQINRLRPGKPLPAPETSASRAAANTAGRAASKAAVAKQYAATNAARKKGTTRAR